MSVISRPQIIRKLGLLFEVNKIILVLENEARAKEIDLFY